MVALNKAIDKQSLRALSPLGKLTHENINDIISKSRVENLPAGRIVFRQGEDDGQTIYLLSGQIELSTAGKTRKTTIKGKSVDAKFPLADQIPRPATAKAKTASSLLYIDSSLLEILLDENPSGEYEVTEIDVAHHATDWMMRFLQSRAFLKLPTENIQKVLMNMEEIHVNKGDTIVKQGEEGDYYYIIKHGCCIVSRQPTKKADQIRLAKLVEGDGFGEEALISNSRRNASVTIQESGTLMRLRKNDFLSLLVTPLIKNVHLNSLKNSLYKESIIIDIRTNNEFKQGSLDKAKHIPLSMIRLRIPTLDTSKQYLLYSDDKDDAKAASFLLAQHGIEGLVVLGSLQQTVLQAEAPIKAEKPISAKPPAADLKIVSNDSENTQPTKASPPEKPAKQQLHAKQQAEQILAEADAIRQSALQDASSLRTKIEKQETLKLRTELAKTRSKAEASIRKNEQQAENIRQQAEQESSQILNQAQLEANKLRQELTNLRTHEAKMKQQLETELQAIRQQAAEQAQLAAKQEAEHAAIEAKQTAQTMALREAEQTRVAADKAAAEIKSIADRLTEKASTIDKEAEQARLKVEKEAREIRQTALQEANNIKQNALDESEKIKKSATHEQEFIISHDDIFNIDDDLGPTIVPVQPYAEEASVALKMAEEIKAGLMVVEQQRIENEQSTRKKSITHTAKITQLDGKVILEGEEDIFIFREPSKCPAKKTVIKTENAQLSEEQAQHANQPKPLTVPGNELSDTDTKPIVFDRFSLPSSQADSTFSEKKDPPKRSILAIAASIFLVISLSLVAYTTKIQINFTEVGARVGQDSIETEEHKVTEQARKVFHEKLSSIKKHK